MSKNPTTAKVTEASATTNAQPEAKKYPIPMDGSGGQKFITDNGGVSKSIRILTEQGFSRGEVAKMLNKRYQHVRNVLITPVKKTAA